MALPVIVSLLALVPRTFGQDKPDICSWQQIRGGVVRDSLYLEGGLRLDGTWSGSNNAYDGCSTATPDHGRLFKFNFSKSFDVTSSNLKSLFEVVEENPDNTAPFYLNGGMFADDDEFYTIGGLAYPGGNSTPSQGAMRVGLFQPNSQATSFSPSANPYYNNIPSGISRYVTHGAGVSVPSENLGFYFSGLTRGPNTQLVWPGFTTTPSQNYTNVSSMLRVDTTSFNNAQWQSVSFTGNISARAGASMVWIPTGARGVLVVLGGTVNPADLYNYQLSTTQIADNNNRSASYIATVSVFDIDSSTWYSVATTGAPTLPNPFVHACAVVASAADGSSHQIFVYGGYDGIGNGNAGGTAFTPPSDEVWVLSVPSFKWIKAASGSTNHGRYAHTCAKPYPNQMITVGGVAARGTSLTTKAIIDNFDLNTLTWTGKYNPTEHANYSVPSVVTSVIGGTGNGGSTDVSSTLDPALRTVFGTRYTKTIPVWYPYVPEATVSPVPAKKKSVAVPVAVSVVVVVVVLVTAIIAWCCFCSPAARKKRSQKSSDDSTRVSNNFIHNWVSSSAQFVPPPKSVISSDATEIGESLSPRAEVAGFSYFTPHARQNFAAEVDGAPLHGQTATGAPYQRATSPGSPGSHGSAELDGVPTPPPGMSEVLGSQRNNEYFRNHPMHPPSLGGQSSGSGPLASRFANARAPSDTTSNAIELPPNRSTENVGLVPPVSDLNRSKSDKSHTETSTDISAPTDSDADARTMAIQSSSGVRTPDLVPHQPLSTKDASNKQQAGKSYPPTALSNIASHSHQRSTSSASSGMAITMSPTSEAYATLSPGEEQRLSDQISMLPEPISRNIAEVAKNKPDGSSQQ